MPKKVKRRRSRCAGRKRKTCKSRRYKKHCRNTRKGKRSKSHCRARRNRTRRMRRRGVRSP